MAAIFEPLFTKLNVGVSGSAKAKTKTFYEVHKGLDYEPKNNVIII